MMITQDFVPIKNNKCNNNKCLTGCRIINIIIYNKIIIHICILILKSYIYTYTLVKTKTTLHDFMVIFIL